MKSRSAILLIHCPDREGLVASVARFIHERHGNILHLDQHVDAEKGVFFMRVEWDLARFTTETSRIGEDFAAALAAPFGMTWSLHFSDAKPRLAVFVSRFSHCLYDILSRWQSGEWQVEVPVIVSNHAELAPVAERFGVPFRHFPDGGDKAAREKAQLELLDEQRIELVVLARYMQILSPQFIAPYAGRIINIHHSFLPAFPGAKPYHSAHARGVKIIGATSHYVTADLDAGPIIEQDVTRVSHKDSVADLVRKGRDLEKLVLARAVRAHLTRRVLSYGNRTVVFD